jgi:hypothetical protein
MEEPFPSPSSVINSANHIDNKDPVVKERIIFKAKNKLQLKTNGFTKPKAIIALKKIAQPNVK